MTEEELEKEANKYADDYATPDLDCSFRAYMFEASKEGYLAGAEPRENRIAELTEWLNDASDEKLKLQMLRVDLVSKIVKQEKRIVDLEEKLANADYQLEGRDLEIKELKAQLEQEKNLSQCMSDHNEQLRELIQKMKCLNEEIIKALNESLDYEWLHAHNGQAKYMYLQTVIDIVNEKFEEISETDKIPDGSITDKEKEE